MMVTHLKWHIDLTYSAGLRVHGQDACAVELVVVLAGLDKAPFLDLPLHCFIVDEEVILAC